MEEIKTATCNISTYEGPLNRLTKIMKEYTIDNKETHIFQKWSQGQKSGYNGFIVIDSIKKDLVDFTLISYRLSKTRIRDK